jgi:hypothetical protein
MRGGLAEDVFHLEHECPVEHPRPDVVRDVVVAGDTRQRAFEVGTEVRKRRLRHRQDVVTEHRGLLGLAEHARNVLVLHVEDGKRRDAAGEKHRARHAEATGHEAMPSLLVVIIDAGRIVHTPGV